MERMTGSRAEGHRMAELTVWDYEQIRQVGYRYCHSIDSGDDDTFLTCFTPDATIHAIRPDTTTAIQGEAALRAFVTDNTRATRGTVRHLALNPLITPTEHGAHMRSYAAVILAGTAPTSGIVVTGTYEDHLTRHHDTWLITQRTITADTTPDPHTLDISDRLVLTLLGLR